MLFVIILCVVTYLLGSIPFAFIYGKIFKKIDIREHGSKNVGATNALRVLGPKAGIIVLALDILKGLLPVLFVIKFIAVDCDASLPISQIADCDSTFAMTQDVDCDFYSGITEGGCIKSELPILSSHFKLWFPVLIGICAIIGHTFTVFLKFKGGKGVATSAGVLLALDPIICALAIGLFLIIVAFTRYVSLGSMLAAVFIIAAKFLTYNLDMNPYKLVFVIILALFIIFKHRTNISRLVKGEENKINFKKK